ncbi:MAG: TetR/AcrR family transcriptional regulator [Deltaproteobacteria bacterium]|nr:TetR/AcrR family transcriptional regulator [Deltaproteobacteria bacterium]
MSADNPTPKPVTKAGPSSRAKILDSAEALFAARGFSGVGLREVAQKVGLGKSSLFHHFPTKLSLYVAVLERILTRMDERLEAVQERPESALAKLRNWVDVVVDTLAENPTYAPLLLRTLFEGDVVDRKDRAHLNGILERILSRVARGLKQGIAAGEIRPVSVPHTLQTLIGMSVYHFASGEFGDDLLQHPVYSAAEVRRRKQHIFLFLEHGLAAEPA